MIDYKEIRKKYIKDGYVSNLRVFEEQEINDLLIGFKNLSEKLKMGENLTYIVQWHVSSKWVYNLCTNERILKLVESIIGPDFYLWDTQLFAKAPYSESTIAWHQDAFYTPLEPSDYVTVWLAIADVDESNGAMRIIPNSHRRGKIPHENLSEHIVIPSISPDSLDLSNSISINLAAGEVSIHGPNIVHGSPGNNSERIRLGFAMRYAPIHVKCKTENFVGFTVKGKSNNGYYKEGEVPKEMYGRLNSDKQWRHQIKIK